MLCCQNDIVYLLHKHKQIFLLAQYCEQCVQLRKTTTKAPSIRKKINNMRLSVVLMQMQNKDVNRALLLLAIFADLASAHILPRWCTISSSPSPRFLLPTFENVCQSSTMGGRSAPRLTRCWPHQILRLRFLHVSPIAWVESSTFASPSPTAV